MPPTWADVSPPPPPDDVGTAGIFGTAVGINLGAKEASPVGKLVGGVGVMTVTAVRVVVTVEPSVVIVVGRAIVDVKGSVE